MAMPRGRPKGTTGRYSKWSPEKIAQLWDDADLMAPYHGRINLTQLARLLKKKCPAYQDDTAEQLRQQLQKKYLKGRTLDQTDAFNEARLRRLLDETDLEQLRQRVEKKYLKRKMRG
jgi:hypothetical protein